jgi:hypothetical protein
MPTATKTKKVECLNPGTGGRMHIDKEVYELFSQAIRHTLQKEGALTFSKMVEGIHNCFAQQQTRFDGSVSWYAITVKKDMEARAVIEVIK